MMGVCAWVHRESGACQTHEAGHRLGLSSDTVHREKGKKLSSVVVSRMGSDA